MTRSLMSALQNKLARAKDALYLGSHKVGRGHAPYFIAEIGNNHNGDFFLAKRSIEEAAKAGAHAVKFQKRSIPDVFAKELRDKPQTKEEIRGKTYGEYREGLEFSFDEFVRLKEIAEFNKVAFFATPFDIPSVDFLEKVGIPFYKIASFDVTNLPLLDYVARTKKPIILSTGTASLEEIDEAVSTILQHHPLLAILHCVSVYPSPDELINLSSIKALERRYSPLPIGYSGHEQDIFPSIASIILGASIIERHFTLSKKLPGPDHASVSIEPSLFADMVATAGRTRKLLGSSRKVILEEEKGARDKHGKSVVAAVAIPKDTVITKNMLTVKSPGYGIRPRDLALLIGKQVLVDIDEDTVIRREDIAWSADTVQKITSRTTRKKKKTAR